jgi:uncharacterized iron-regulated membrane protein
MFRRVIFWVHLTAGISAGLAIAILSFTGAALAFEKELIAWAERDARRVEAPRAGESPLSLPVSPWRGAASSAAQPSKRPRCRGTV